jgi:hypothetical protein
VSIDQDIPILMDLYVSIVISILIDRDISISSDRDITILATGPYSELVESISHPLKSVSVVKFDAGDWSRGATLRSVQKVDRPYGVLVPSRTPVQSVSLALH